MTVFYQNKKPRKEKIHILINLEMFGKKKNSDKTDGWYSSWSKAIFKLIILHNYQKWLYPNDYIIFRSVSIIMSLNITIQMEDFHRTRSLSYLLRWAIYKTLSLTFNKPMDYLYKLNFI